MSEETDAVKSHNEPLDQASSEELVDELRRQKLFDNHALKMEQLKSKFLEEKIIKDRNEFLTIWIN